MDAGVKERNRYKDITWLMPSVDLPKVFLKLGVIVEPKHGDEIRGFCPDHLIYTGRKQSGMDWAVNTVTGETFCFSEARGSNLVWTVCRLLKCEPEDAAMFLAGKSTRADMAELEIAAISVKASNLHKQKGDKKPSEIKGLDALAKDIENRKLSERAYQFFIHPTGKKYPTNISRETVDRYRVFEQTWGFHKDRVIIPYFMKGELVGFSAIDLLGKEAWLKAHPDQTKYMKVRYPLSFISTECLFGFDDCKKGMDFIIVTEGAREVMKLTQEGFPAVAILGAYISTTHQALLFDLRPKKIILMFDGDDAGVAITTRTAKALMKNGVYPENRIQKCFLPKGRDPKTLDRNGLLQLIEKGQK